MKKTELATSILLSILVFICSCILVFYALILSEGAQDNLLILLSSGISAVYALCISTCCVWAWFGGGSRPTKITILISAPVLFLLFIGSMDLGTVSGQELLAILFVACIQFIAWGSIRYVADKRSDTYCSESRGNCRPNNPATEHRRRNF